MEPKKKKFLPRPEYKGGPKALGAFIQSQLKYPESAIKNKLEGVVMVRIEINHLGEVIAAKVLRSLSDDCDLEALRVTKLLKFTVAKVRNLKISFFKNINVNFMLPEVAKSSINYIITSKSNESNVPKANYTYTIKI